MLDWIYEWVKNICFYMILISAVLKAVPGIQYEKYIRFFSGIVLILLLASPILKMSGMENKITEIYHNNEYRQEKMEIEMIEKYFEETNLIDFLPNEYMEPSKENESIEIAPIEVKE